MILVIIGETVTISKSFKHNLSNIPGKHEIKELQKTDMLGTAHLILRVLMYVKLQNVCVGDSVTCALYCNYGIAAKVYTLEVWFVLVIYM